MQSVKSYQTIIFDCDGVLFNSNFFKLEIFLDIASNYGDIGISEMEKILSAYPGQSRYFLFRKFIESLSKNKINNINIENLLDEFSKICTKKYLQASRSNYINKLARFLNAQAMVVSSSDQIELNKIFSQLKMKNFFPLGIFGSPSNKYQIIEQCLSKGVIKPKVLYFGDGLIDIEVCEHFKFDMVFLTDWTMMRDYNRICSIKKIAMFKSLKSYYLFLKKRNRL